MTTARLDIFHAIAEIIAAGYHFDKHGICRSPGKYEAESIETIYFDTDESDRESLYFGSEEVQCDLIETTAEERAIFGAEESQSVFALEYSDNGFVSGTWINTERAEELRCEDSTTIENEESNG